MLITRRISTCLKCEGQFMSCVCSNLNCTKQSFCDEQLQNWHSWAYSLRTPSELLKMYSRGLRGAGLMWDTTPNAPNLESSAPLSQMLHDLLCLLCESVGGIREGSGYTPEHRLSKRFIFSTAQLSSGTDFSPNVLPSKVHNKQSISTFCFNTQQLVK